ncbi:hypothetical protein AVEN_42748-2-1, partial [Araneus ventricosus]
ELEENLKIIERILEKFTDYKTIVNEDFNAKSPAWGQGNLDEREQIKIDEIVKEDGELTKDYKESRDFILRKHFPLIDDHYELTEEELPDIEEYKFTKQENGIKGMKRGGAPEYDGWTIELVEECYFTDSEWFTQVLNTCFINGFFPEKLEDSRSYFDSQGGERLEGLQVI